MTSAEAQAFKRACSCFGLGRCFYDFAAPWVDLDDKGRPKKTPTVPSWLIPENWRKGARPSGKASGANGSATPSHAAGGNNGHANGNGSCNGRANPTPPTRNGSEIRVRQQAKMAQVAAGCRRCGTNKNGPKPSENAAKNGNGADLDKRIPLWKNLSAASSTDGFYGNTAMPTSLTWCATSSRRRRFSTCWSRPRGACAAWRLSSIASRSKRSVPCWQSCKPLP